MRAWDGAKHGPAGGGKGVGGGGHDGDGNKKVRKAVSSACLA